MLAYVLTIGRLVLAAIFAALVAILAPDGHLSTAVGAGLIALAIVAELTDIFDGWAARRFGTASRLGGILDPLVDSLSRSAIYFAMALAGWITLAVPFVMITRDIIVAYTRIANASEGAATSARFSGKFKAIIQGGGIPVVIALAMATVIDAIGGQAIETLRIIAACILILVTLWSMIDYIVGAWTAVRKMMSAE